MSEPAVRYGDDCVTFSLNDHIQKVSSMPGDTSLNTYIREYAGLKGTKFMCREGGCGTCVVTLQFTHPATGLEKVVSVNSCMFPVLACHGLKVITVEGIGSRKTGYNEIQARLAHFNGSQCGYCSPGWVMSMYSLLKADPNITMKEIEDSLSGNLCRCTGYRPILDAFKSFASDKNYDLQNKLTDIEDVLKVCKKSGTICHGKCKLETSKREPFDCLEKNDDDNVIDFVEVGLALPSLKLQLHGGAHWYRVAFVDEIFEIFDMINGTYRLVGGNTSIGILKGLPAPEVFIDVNGVSSLKAHSLSSNILYVGANTTLADAITLFRAVAVETPADFSYTEQLARHIEKVANTPVRNVGTLAGNLSIKHEAREFQSDIFLILETVGAKLSVRGQNESVRLLTLPEYLATNMYKKLILQIVLYPMDSNTNIVKTYKIAPRAQNAVASVNAGFRFTVNRKDGFRLLTQPAIVFGNINPLFIHAEQTERYLVGKRLVDVTILQKALHILSKEVQPDYILPDTTPQYRRGLALALLYRVVLSLSPNNVKAQYQSGGKDITRPLSSGRQEFETNSSNPPLYQPFPKLESLIQCSGEAEYIYDIPVVSCDLHAALVITRTGPAVLDSVNPSSALKVSGVIAFFSAKDIPGRNIFTPRQHPFVPDDEQLFADKNILYAGQPVGMVVARTQELADAAADLVQIVYKSKEKPVLDLREIVKSGNKERIFLRMETEATTIKPNVTKVVQGDFLTNEQYHFAMEMLTCLIVPTEDGQELDVYCSTQWNQLVQETISILTNIPQNRINVKTRRIGGSYGLKISRPNIVGGACGLAASLLQRPVRMVVKLETMMEAIGKRASTLVFYESGVNNEGEIQYLKASYYVDDGSAFNDPSLLNVVIQYANVYDSSTWSTKMYDVKTDKPCSVWTRAPGTLDAVAIAEVIMEHIAHEVGRDPLAVRMINLNNEYPIQNIIDILNEKSDLQSRKQAVEEFNKTQTWKKRGISLVPIRNTIETLGNYHATVSVYSREGTIALSHGGIEMGQGINTKAAQVCASTLGIPLDTVVVKSSDVFTSPNNQTSGGSQTTDGVCAAVERCCEELNRRLQPFRVDGFQTWDSLTQAAGLAHIDLKATQMFAPNQGDLKLYDVFGGSVMEVEVDILTGEFKIIRVDILQDAGKSLNQLIDVGQIEGAYIMGVGRWTSEQTIKDPNTGRTLTNRTLKYEIPGPKDIPIDFRVYILKNADNPLGVLGSKGIGEPPISSSCSIMFAIQEALRSARSDCGLPHQWLPIDSPYTAERIFLSSGIDEKNYLL